jgi:hypothetical protein
MTITQGRSSHHSSIEAGREAASQALAAIEAGGGKPGWALLFAGGRHDCKELLAAVRGVLGDILVIGGSTVGTIHKEGSSYTHFEVLLTLLPLELAPAAVVFASLKDGEKEAGRIIGRCLAESGQPGSSALVFYDSIEQTPPPKLYVGGSLLDGIYDELGELGSQIAIFGGGMVGDLQMANSFVFDGTGVQQHIAVGVLLPHAMEAHCKTMHGCIPISAPMEITAVDGNCIFELDGKPALDVILEVTGSDRSEESLRRICLGISVGKNYGELWGEYDENNYVNRLLIAANPQNGSIIIFDDDFTVGDQVELMSRDNDLMVKSVRSGTIAMTEALATHDALFALYIDCAGRSSAWCGHSEEEADTFRDCFGLPVPIMGCYIGVEMTPVRGRTRPCDWNGVLTVFTLRQDR